MTDWASKISLNVEGCWVWQDSLATNGYGHLRVGQKFRLAHRYVYEAHYGPIPKDLVIDHICRNRACVNPDHLRVVTQRENVLDNSLSIQADNFAKTHCKYGHEFTPENTYTPKGTEHRVCRECGRNRSREYQRQKRGYYD